VILNDTKRSQCKQSYDIEAVHTDDLIPNQSPILNCLNSNTIFVGSKARCVDLSLHLDRQILYYLAPMANRLTDNDSLTLQSKDQRVIMPD
jgi:hypothetical protein